MDHIITRVGPPLFCSIRLARLLVLNLIHTLYLFKLASEEIPLARLRGSLDIIPGEGRSPLILTPHPTN